MLESITSARNDFNQSIQVPPSPFLTFTRRRRPPSSSRAGIKDALGLGRMEGGDAGAFSGCSAVITLRAQRVHPQWQTGLVNRETGAKTVLLRAEKRSHTILAFLIFYFGLPLVLVATHLLVFLCSLLTSITAIVDLQEVLRPLRFTETRQFSRTDIDRLVLPFSVAVILCLCVCLPHTDTPNTDLCVLQRRRKRGFDGKPINKNTSYLD